jgi:hypothetical protein
MNILRPKENKFIFNDCYFLRDNYPEIKVNFAGRSEIFVIKPEIYEYSTGNYLEEEAV